MNLHEKPKFQFIDQLLADIKPRHKELVVKTENTTLRFRVVTDSAELARIKDRCKQLADFCEKPTSLEPWKELLPIPRDIGARAALVAELSLDGIEQIDAVRIAVANGIFFDGICEAIDRATAIEVNYEMSDGVTAAKNDSGETLDGEIA